MLFETIWEATEDFRKNPSCYSTNLKHYFIVRVYTPETRYKIVGTNKSTPPERYDVVAENHSRSGWNYEL